MGLALVKRVIDICGGEIYVSSQLYLKSIFTVKLRGSTNVKVERVTLETIISSQHFDISFIKCVIQNIYDRFV